MPVSVGNTSFDHPFTYGSPKMIPDCLAIAQELKAMGVHTYPPMLRENLSLMEKIANKFVEELAIKRGEKILVMQKSGAEIAVLMSDNLTYDPINIAGQVVTLYTDFADNQEEVRSFVHEIYAEYGIRVGKILATMIAAPLVNDDFGAKVYALVEV